VAGGDDGDEDDASRWALKVVQSHSTAGPVPLTNQHIYRCLYNSCLCFMHMSLQSFDFKRDFSYK